MEEVEAEDPVAYVGGIHEAQLTLACGVLNEGWTGELVRDVVYLEWDVFELDIVISTTDRRWKSILQLIEVQIRIVFYNDLNKLIEVFRWNQGKWCSCVHYKLINLDLNRHVPILDITHRQCPIVGIKKVMPDETTRRVSIQVEPTNHHLALFKVFTYGECKEILVDSPLVVQLLYEQGGALAPGHWS